MTNYRINKDGADSVSDTCPDINLDHAVFMRDSASCWIIITECPIARNEIIRSQSNQWDKVKLYKRIPDLSQYRSVLVFYYDTMSKHDKAIYNAYAFMRDTLASNNNTVFASLNYVKSRTYAPYTAISIFAVVNGKIDSITYKLRHMLGNSAKTDDYGNLVIRAGTLTWRGELQVIFNNLGFTVQIDS